MRRAAWLVVALAVGMTAFFAAPAFAAVSVSPATGGGAISADTAATGGTGAFTTLTGPSAAESAAGEVTTGSLILTAPSGFEFDSASTVNVTSNPQSGGNTTGLRISDSSSCPAGGIRDINVTPTSSQITFYVCTDSSSTGKKGTLAFSGVKVRPTDGTPLASGTLYLDTASTSSVTGVVKGAAGTSWGQLTEAAGALDHVVVSPTSATVTTGGTQTFSATPEDQFDNDRTDAVGWTADPAAGSVSPASGASTVFTAGGTPGTFPTAVTATSGAESASASVTVTTGPVANVTLALSPDTITADGADTSTATASATDAFGNPRIGDTISITTSGDAAVGAVTDNGDGTYSATITASTTAGDETITASDSGVTDTATLHEVVGPADSVSLVLTPDTVTANGTDTSTATATVTDAFGNPRIGDTVTLGTSGDATIGAVTDNGDGTYTATITASTTAGDETITATDGAASGTATLHEVSGAAASVSLALSPDTITANGTDTSTATATVIDAFGNPVAGDTISITTSGDTTIGPVTDNGDGTYTATIVASTTAGDETITASDAGVFGTAVLHEQAGAAASLGLALSPDTITANGTDTSTATATVLDAFGNGVAGETVTVSTSGDVTIGLVTDNGDGTYTATITASTTPGDETITATDGLLSDTATLHEIVGPPASVTLTLSPDTVTANGTDTSTATASVTDAVGNPRIGDTVTISSSGDATVGAVTDNGDGTYTATITASTTPGDETITASDAGAFGTAVLHEVLVTPGPAASISLTLSPTVITANGSDTSTATAIVEDTFGNPVTGETVTITTSGDVSIGPVTDNGDGSYSATITASVTPGDETITAAVGSLSDTATLHESTGVASTISLALSPDTVTADGADTSTATATVEDAFGNPVTGDTVTISTSGDVSIGAVTDNGDGTYSATITASTTAGDETITATDGALSDTATLHEVVGPAAAVSLTLSPDTVTANGADTSTATATVTDGAGNLVAGETVTISTSGDATVGPVTDNGDGTYTATIVASTTADDETITAADGALSDTATLHEVAGPAASVAVALSPDTITADGADTSAATATVADAFGNPVSGDTVTISTSGDVSIGAVTDNGDGTYSATITASTTAGDETITATDGAAAGTAILHEVAGALDHLVLDPSTATITAGGSQAYTAEGFDVNGNSLGDVTAGTTFTIAPDGSCTGSSCSATQAGPHSVTGTNGSATGAASLEVDPGPLASIEISPASATITAGGSQTYTVEGFDSFGNTLGNVTTGTTFSIAPDGTCAGDTCSATASGSHTVTGTNGTATDTASLAVTPAAVDSVSLTLTPDTITANGTSASTATATAADSFGNPRVGDTVTISTSGDAAVGPVTDNGDGTYSATITASTTAGDETITASDAGVFGTATLHEVAGPLDHLALSPASATIPASGSQAYTAEGRDAFDNSLGDVTASTVFTIAPDGSCTGNSCSATAAGPHTVTGTLGTATGTASLTVTPAVLDHIVISPSNATIPIGGSQTYTAEGFDVFNNSMGDVTAGTTFSIAPNGSCSADVCGASIAGVHTVTGTNGSASDTATLVVTSSLTVSGPASIGLGQDATITVTQIPPAATGVSLTVTRPGGTTFVKAPLAYTAGASTATFRLDPGDLATAGTYGLLAQANQSGSAIASGTGSLVVAPTTMTLTVTPSTVGSQGTVTIKATIKRSDTLAGVPGISVSISVRYLLLTTASGTVLTSNDGEGSLVVGGLATLLPGTYIVSATTTHHSASTSFTVTVP